MDNYKKMTSECGGFIKSTENGKVICDLKILMICNNRSYYYI